MRAHVSTYSNYARANNAVLLFITMLNVYSYMVCSNFTLKHARVVRQPADGSCLFHALNYGIKGSSDVALRRHAHTHRPPPLLPLADSHVFTRERAGKSRSLFEITQIWRCRTTRSRFESAHHLAHYTCNMSPTWFNTHNTRHMHASTGLDQMVWLRTGGIVHTQNAVARLGRGHRDGGVFTNEQSERSCVRTVSSGSRIYEN